MNDKGFTIVELMIAIIVLVIGILGAYNAFSNELILTTNASLRLVASYLAQEGMELVRNTRDNNWLAISQGSTTVTSWDDFIKDCSGGCEADYKYDYTQGIFKTYSAADFLQNDPQTRLYSYTAGNPTTFTRKIVVNSVDPNVLKVSVTVYWTTFGKPDSFQVEEYLYNWF